MIDLPLKERVINQLTKHLYGTFGAENPELREAFGFEDRFRIVGDTEMFNHKEDEYVWKQQVGDIKEVFQVFFDGEYMCNFTEDDHFKYVLLTFFMAFKEKYKDGTIKLIKEDYQREFDMQEDEKAEALKRIKLIKPESNIESMAKEVLTNVVKEK